MVRKLLAAALIGSSLVTVPLQAQAASFGDVWGNWHWPRPKPRCHWEEYGHWEKVGHWEWVGRWERVGHWEWNWVRRGREWVREREWVWEWKWVRDREWVWEWKWVTDRKWVCDGGGPVSP